MFGAGNMVEGTVALDSIDRFIDQFRLASRGTLTFLLGNEGSWTIDLTGSNAASQSMARCVSALADAQTQPYTPSDQMKRPVQTQPW